MALNAEAQAVNTLSGSPPHTAGPPLISGGCGRPPWLQVRLSRALSCWRVCGQTCKKGGAETRLYRVAQCALSGAWGRSHGLGSWRCCSQISLVLIHLMVQAPTRNIYRIVSESSERPHAQERDITHTTLSVLLRAQRADLEAAPRRSLHKVFKACIPCRRHGLPLHRAGSESPVSP